VRAAEQQPPEVWLARVDDALIYDHVASQWWGMSSEPEGWRELVPPGMRTLTAGSVASGVSGARGGLAASDARFTLDPLVPEVPRALFEAMVARVLAYIHAGDCYQVNLAHRLSAAFEGDARALFLSLLNAARPWYGSYFELAGDADPSASPPCFVHCGSSPEGFIEISAPAGDGTRTITTRPMKGTRRASDATSADLAAAAKDRAELAMIVDLMRNDLGRVAQLGSVRVTQPHTIERHGTGHTTLLQATATITASLAPSTSIADVLRATFPPGSVTGAPKIRAMQIIDELEHAERGPYCGCAGFLGDDGSARLSVNIRSALIERARKARADEAARGPAPDRSRLRANPARFPAGSRLSYWVGAGIVAESEPASEWDETLAKAGAIRAIAQAPSASSVGASQEP
jgi:para-aminobenzoate synthetase component 1